MNKKDDMKGTGNDLTEEDKAIAGEALQDDDQQGDDDTSDDSIVSTSTITDGRETLVTREGLKKLKEELEELEGVKRKEVSQRLREAISYGDLSENSEYEDAKNEQAFVEGRIIELTEIIKRVKIIADKSSRSKGKTVKIGSTVTVQNLTDKDDPETYTIVGSTEADPREAKISNESPIGAAIIEKDQGDEVSVRAPAGSFKYKIIKVA